ncbi:hypothetical protein FRC10_001778 [Ceratobasidium sp. 414]|nr:hypothetical protein FRC10_001778 [Ceratobasidium sp. 414]
MGEFLTSLILSSVVANSLQIISKFGGGGVAGASEANVDRRERLRKLALETIDLAKDPYILRNHLGSLECRLCLTLHTNEGSYLAHTQGKKHQTNLARRAARDAKDTQLITAPAPASTVPRKMFIKIGRPGYRVTKVRDPLTAAAVGGGGAKEGMMVQVHLPQIKEGVIPRRRFMSAWEQKKEQPNRAYQYLIVAAEPYESIAFRIPAREIEDAEENPDWNWSHWDADTKQYSFQFMFRTSSLTYMQTLSTTLLALPQAYARLVPQGKVVLLPQLQETHDYPCDTGSDRAVLEATEEFEGLAAQGVDWSPLTEDWNKNEGFYAPTLEALANRAKWVRNYVRSRPEKNIILVGHGGIFREIDGRSRSDDLVVVNSLATWGNVEVRLYTFLSDDDEAAIMVPISEPSLADQVGKPEDPHGELNVV